VRLAVRVHGDGVMGGPMEIATSLAPLIGEAMADYPPEIDSWMLIVSTRLLWVRSGTTVYGAWPDEAGVRFGEVAPPRKRRKHE